MKKSCAYCGRIHEYGEVCPLKPKKKARSRRPDRSSTAVKFRSGRDWTAKAIAIKKRDKYMCRVCLDGKYPLKEDMVFERKSPFGDMRIVFAELEVHHIEKISERYDLRLDESNLITLCRKHHQMAECGEIPAKYLKELAEKEVF